METTGCAPKPNAWFAPIEKSAAANAEARTASAGRRFGAWQTTRLLARGGMGEVWLAHRADGQHRQQAALKILSPYLAAPDSVHRFRRERELLARLEHPNIARLLDGGMSALGEPYLVMEYVEGVRLDRYCDEHRLSVPERLNYLSRFAPPLTPLINISSCIAI